MTPFVHDTATVTIRVTFVTVNGMTGVENIMACILGRFFISVDNT